MFLRDTTNKKKMEIFRKAEENGSPLNPSVVTFFEIL